MPEPKEKGDNIFVRFYKNNGVGGVVELLQRLVKELKGMFGRIARSFTINELFVSLLVGAGDSSETAIKYGKVCSAVFPAMGFITSNMRVKKYSLDVNPDFIEGKNKARLHTEIAVRPIKLINALIVSGVAMLFRIVIKFLKGSKAKKAPAEEKSKDISVPTT